MVILENNNMEHTAEENLNLVTDTYELDGSV
jgi:hypothetical protein